jgi:probable F420-dependent oxidoreductase
MPRSFRFAWQGRGLDDLDAIVARAQQLEALGYDELWSYDHIGAVDPFVPLMVAAGATSRLRVGPLVLNNEFHQPALLARTAATVDRLTGGRLVLGLGTGYAQAEHDAIGLVLRPPAERVDRFGESIAVLRALLDDGSCTFDGAHHHIAVENLGVRPLQSRVPFLVGGHGRRVIDIAGRHADIFQFTGLRNLGTGSTDGPDVSGFALDEIVRRAQWLTDAAGERNADIERSTLVQVVHVGDGADEALEATADEVRLPVEVVRDTPFVLIGSVEQVIDKVERLREQVGISHYVVRDPEAMAPVVAALAGR